MIKSDDGRDVPIITMGPICITPELKRKGYGKILLDYSLEKVAAMGFGAVCFEGNIDFYGKSGFTYASEYGIRYHGLPEGEDASFFLCKELIPGYLDGITGEYATPEGYMVDENEAEKYDATFPTKEKLKLPGQLYSDFLTNKSQFYNDNRGRCCLMATPSSFGTKSACRPRTYIL